MSAENTQGRTRKQDEPSRAQRIERLRQVIESHGEEAARVLQMWLQQKHEEDTGGRR